MPLRVDSSTGKPIPEDIPSNPPWVPDAAREVETPFALAEWIDNNRAAVRDSGRVPLFAENRYQTDVIVLGKGQGQRTLTSPGGETFLWQREGEATVTLTSKDGEKKTAAVVVKADETLLVPEESEFVFDPSDDCVCLSVLMNPANKARL